MLSPDSRIVMLLADRATESVGRKVVRRLQQLPNETTVDILPHLRTVWDEVCVQVQGEESLYWDAYLEQIEIFVYHEVACLPRLEREAIWMQTDPGSDWEFDETRLDNEPPVLEADVVQHVLSHLLTIAANWTNAAIRAQQEADGQRYLDTDR